MYRLLWRVRGVALLVAGKGDRESLQRYYVKTLQL
jgi:hypothetical protein